jgi:HSP20 family protein
MAGFRKSTLDELGRLEERTHLLLDEVLAESGFAVADGTSPGTWAPALDLVETPDAYLLAIDLPGVAPGDIELEVVERRLVLTGRRQPPGEGSSFLQMERSHGAFRRAVELAADVLGDGLESSFVRGVLQVRVPKRTTAAGSTP